MHKFIESIANGKQLNFKYAEYDSLFIKHSYNSYYLFFFLKHKEQLLELQKKSGDIFLLIKESKGLYQPDMDKNITCIFCLCVREEEYYRTVNSENISDLSKAICIVEEDLNYFKKNVLLYTEEMEKFAQSNKVEFELLCQKYFTEDNFQLYKRSNRDCYKYDFLINLFIKIPFLNFKKYQLNDHKKYRTMENFIEIKCRDRQIDRSFMDKITMILQEKLEDESELNEWLDMLIEECSDEKWEAEVTENES